MCGICGFVALNGRPSGEPDQLKRMADRLVHRGPDDEGFHLDAVAGLANRRLSIVDLPGGHQPIYSEDGKTCVVFNGEIYNQKALRADLEKKGHAFSTHSDTEVLVHLYEEYGERCVEHLNGMFAFAVWNSQKQQGLIARDRLGIKPLYYALRPDLLLFGSEAKALLAHPALAAELDEEALDLYLTLRYVPAEKTIFSGIAKLLPGHLLCIDARQGRVDAKRYWHPETTPDRMGCEEQVAEEIGALLSDAVRIRLMSDVPFGAFLSGGLDSSAVVALMSRHMEEPVKTFSIGFSEQGTLDETAHARQVAFACGSEHREVDCTAEKVEVLPRLIHHFDEPFADPIIVPTYQVSELAARHVKVVLTGEGADEVFGGYTRFVSDQSVRRLGALPAWVRTLLQGGARALPGALGEQVGRALQMGALPLAARFLAWVEAFSDSEKEALFLPMGRRSKARSALALYERCVGECAGAETTSSFLYTEMKLRLPECMLSRTDRMTMAVSLEGRTPFLDHRLVERALRLPGHFKVRGKREKYILKQALSRVLPESIVSRRKQGLAVPFAQWARYGIEGHMRRILAPAAIERRGLFDPAAVAGLLDRWGPHAARHSQRVWSLLCLELWCRMYLDGDLDPRTPLSEVA